MNRESNGQFTPQQIYTARLMLWALRCHFITIKGGHLTPKATWFLPPFAWRIVLRVYCYFNPQFKKDMGSFLGKFINAKSDPNLDLEKHLSNYN